MTVKQLVEKLKEFPEDYEVIYESGDLHSNAYYAYVECIVANHKTREVELCE